MVIVPVVCGVGAVGLLAYDHFSRAQRAHAWRSTGVTLLLVLVRTALVFAREPARAGPQPPRGADRPAHRPEQPAQPDGRPRGGAAARPRPKSAVRAGPVRPGRLQGVQRRLRPPAGDGLLVRLGERLADAVTGHGRAYRLGGDEFCVVLHPGAAGLEPAGGRLRGGAGRARRGLRGDHLARRRSMAPVEVTGATEALQLADRRMYARKGDRRVSAGRQSRDVLLRSLSERQPDLHVHLRGTADLALAVGRELGMDGEELDDVAHAAELHDVGKIAIPDAILREVRPARRDRVGLHAPPHDHRRAHPARGPGAAQRGAPGALEPRALGRRRLPRRPARRGDPARRPRGGGLRRLRRDDHQPPLPRPVGEPAALAELRRCAGTQFDPARRGGVRARAGARDGRRRRIGAAAAQRRSAQRHGLPGAARRA